VDIWQQSLLFQEGGEVIGRILSKTITSLYNQKVLRGTEGKGGGY
jgi:hypothetical protein